MKLQHNTVRGFYLRYIAVMVVCGIIAFFSFSCGRNSIMNAMDFLPRETDVPGWAQTSANSVRSLKRIRALDGNYPLYGVQAVATAYFSSVSAPETTLQVRVIKCETSMNSFGLFSLERGFSSIRNEKEDSYYSDGGFFFRKGDFYVKIMANNIDDARKTDLNEFQEIINTLIDPVALDEPLPSWLYAFSQGKSLNDAVFYKNGSPLLPEVNNLVVRKRVIDGKDRYIFFHKYVNAEHSAGILVKIVKTDPEFIFSKSGGVQYLQKENPEGGMILVTVKDLWLFGVFNAENIQEGSRIILTLKNELSGL